MLTTWLVRQWFHYLNNVFSGAAVQAVFQHGICYCLTRFHLELWITYRDLSIFRNSQFTAKLKRNSRFLCLSVHKVYFLFLFVLASPCSDGCSFDNSGCDLLRPPIA